MNIDCNIHAASFVKGDEHEEYDNTEALLPAVGISGEFTFVYDYPLSRVANFKHKLTPEMTGEDILMLARLDYEKIYKDEEEAVGNPGNIPGMLNRATSKGPYGIWGHDFSDLFFEGIDIDTTQMRIEFSMGS